MKAAHALPEDTVTEAEANKPIFHDWARFVSFQPQLYFRPRDLDELGSFLIGIQQGDLQTRVPSRPGWSAFLLRCLCV